MSALQIYFGRMLMGRRPNRLLAIIDGVVVAAMVTGFVWLQRSAGDAAGEAVRLYGHNVDSGAIASAAATVYCFPNAVLFALSATAMALGSKFRWLIQAGAVAWLIVPVVFTVI